MTRRTGWALLLTVNVLGYCILSLSQATTAAATKREHALASMVGFIFLCGIATRNGILLLDHYLHLVKYEGETWSGGMLIRAGQQRLAPVLMTVLTAGIGLVPLALAAGEPGKEMLYPIGTVIIGGLVSSTLLEFLVRPALFWTFGRPAARRLVAQTGSDPLPKP